MYKKILVNLTAITTAVSMLIAPSITAFAEELPAEGSSSIEENTPDTPSDIISGDIVKTDGTSAVNANAQEVTVIGNITTTGEIENRQYEDHDGNVHHVADPAVKATNGSTVIIEGNINAGQNSGAEQTAISANNSTVIVDADNPVLVSGSDNGIDAQAGSIVYVDGDVSAAHDGIRAESSAVTVTGNVRSTGMEVDIHDSKTDEIIGVSVVGSGVYVSGKDSFVAVQGNVDAISNGVEINIGDNNFDYGNSTVIVEGTITGGLNVHTNSGNSALDKNTIIDRLPNLTVYQLDGISTIFDELTTEERQEVRNQLINSINYIIKADSGISFDNPTDSTYQTTNIGKSFKVKASLDSSQMLDAGSNSTVVDNGDGTYTITLNNYHGGINIKAILRPVTNDDGSTSYEVVVENTASSDTNQAPEGAIVVNTSATSDAAMAAISGDKPARAISFKMANITPAQYKNAIIQNISTVPTNGALNIETDRIACLDSAMIEALALRSDIDVNVVFTYGGKRLKVTIPAGYNVRSLLDNFGYCGFLRLMSILGSTEL